MKFPAKFRAGDLVRDYRMSPRWVGASVVYRIERVCGQDWLVGLDVRDLATVRRCRACDAVRLGRLNIDLFGTVDEG